MKAVITVGAALLVLSALGQKPASLSRDLETLVEAERAFAKTATEKGIRDSFLEYFAEDAIAFNPAPLSATERLRSRPSRPFSELELRWEPRTGDVAASGELGWLTGPSVFIDHTSGKPEPQQGNYLSVWRRQAGGPWRVFIDVGSSPPQPVTFADGFTQFQLPSRYAGGDTKALASAALLEADKALNVRIGTVGAGSAYAAVTTGSSRLHRSGFMPSIGSDAIRAWMKTNATVMSASTGSGESAISGDLGYSYGIYEVKSPVAERGAFVRVWQRDRSGRWLLVADVTQKS